MKRVSFKVAKAIKEAGYPQEGNAHSTYYDEQHKEAFIPFECNRSRDYLAPSYLEVRLWLWREKKIWLQIRHIGNGNWFKCWATEQDFYDPEEAIVAAIESLVDNDLIK